jgi:hypothetical protein
MKLASERDEGHVDDRRIERVHEHCGDIDGGDDVALINTA